MASVSVIGNFCVVAGSASTIAMLKEKEGPSWLKSLKLPHLWVDVHGNIWDKIDQEGMTFAADSGKKVATIYAITSFD